MTSKENLEEKLHRLSQAIGSDDKLLKNVMSKIRSAPAAGEAGAGHIRRIIMKYLLTKLAAAAAIAVVFWIAISYLGGSTNGTSKVYAAMIKALHNVNTVHVSGWTTNIYPLYTTVGDKPYDTSEQYPIEIWEWFTEDGSYRMFDRQGPITVWQGEDRRYQYQANKDRLYISTYKTFKSSAQLSEKFQFLKTDIESEKTYKIKKLGTRLIDGKEAQGYQGERGNKRDEIWVDTQTNLLLESNVYALNNGRWEQYWYKTVTYDQDVPEHIRAYTPPDAKNVEYSSDINPRFEEYHAQLREIESYYKTHSLPETMELWPRRDKGQQLRNAYGPGRLNGITDTTGYWVLPLESTLADFLRRRVKPYGSLRVPEELQTIELNVDLITKNEHSSRERVDFVLDSLGLEIVEIVEPRKVWIAHYDGRPLKPWREVKAPVARGDARALHPGMDFNSNPCTMEHLLESFAYYQDYDLEADRLIIIDETGLPSKPAEGQSEESIAVSSASPYWDGDESIEMARKWFREQFGVTFTEEIRTVTVYLVRRCNRE